MTIFDKKEEVIDIVLTKYGRKKLSEGNFNPTFYSFFDDDIIYDSRYGGYGEHQNDTEPRLKDSTISLKLPRASSKSSNEREFFNQKTSERNSTKISRMGSSDLHKDKVPSWEANILQGRVSEMKQVYTGSNVNNINIPQIDLDIRYETSAKSQFANKMEPKISFQLGFTSEEFDDGSYLEISGEEILVELLERNTEFELSNFILEFFVQEDNSDGEVFIPLNFNNDEDENGVEYYFDISVDNHIDDRILCENVKKDRKRGVYDKQIFKCAKEIGTEERGLYSPQDNIDEGDIC